MFTLVKVVEFFLHLKFNFKFVLQGVQWTHLRLIFQPRKHLELQLVASNKVRKHAAQVTTKTAREVRYSIEKTLCIIIFILLEIDSQVNSNTLSLYYSDQNVIVKNVSSYSGTESCTYCWITTSVNCKSHTCPYPAGSVVNAVL